MQSATIKKDASYHRSAIVYNEKLAEFAAALVDDPEIDHPEIKKWCNSVSKQHLFHSGRHQRALAKIEGETDTKPAEFTDEEKAEADAFDEQDRESTPEEDARNAELMEQGLSETAVVDDEVTA